MAGTTVEIKVESLSERDEAAGEIKRNCHPPGGCNRPCNRAVRGCSLLQGSPSSCPSPSTPPPTSPAPQAPSLLPLALYSHCHLFLRLLLVVPENPPRDASCREISSRKRTRWNSHGMNYKVPSSVNIRPSWLYDDFYNDDSSVHGLFVVRHSASNDPNVRTTDQHVTAT
jgi:hypothetical protein